MVRYMVDSYLILLVLSNLVNFVFSNSFVATKWGYTPRLSNFGVGNFFLCLVLRQRVISFFFCFEASLSKNLFSSFFWIFDFGLRLSRRDPLRPIQLFFLFFGLPPSFLVNRFVVEKLSGEHSEWIYHLLVSTGL